MGRARNKKWIVRLATFWLCLASTQAAVELGIDVLASHDYSLLKGKRVGLITNQTGANSAGAKTRLLLKKHCNLARFTPRSTGSTEPKKRADTSKAGATWRRA